MTVTTSRRQFLQSSLLVGTTAVAGSIPSFGSVSPDGGEQSRIVEPFGDATVISGNPRERGRQYGRLFADGIAEFLDREIVSALIKTPNQREHAVRYAGACWKVIRTECPEIADELEGMAESTGLRIEDHVLLTLHEELYHFGMLPPVSHCTAVAVGVPETRDDVTLVGQTWDWMPRVAGMSRMLEWKRTDGPSLLAYAFPGLWVGAGLNSAGLSLCWTSAALGVSGQMPRVGLPAYVLLAHLLYQESLDAVRGFAERNRHAGWFTFAMGDADGRLMNIEGSSDSVVVEETRGRLIRVGYGTSGMTRTPPGEIVKVHPRCNTMERLLANEAGTIDLGTIKQSFADPDRGICGKNTIDIMVYDTTHRTAHLSRGPKFGAGVAWTQYQFSPG